MRSSGPTIPRNGSSCKPPSGADPRFLPVGRGALARTASPELAVWHLDLDLPAATLGALAGLLSDDERARADRFRTAELRDGYVAAHGQLRLVVGARLDVDPAALSVAADGFGRPFLVDDGRRVDFNLSHSGPFGLLAIATGGRVGADIEAVRDFDGRAGIAERCFAPSELRGLLGLDESRSLDGFFACWTRKEAFIKADGRGLSLPLDGFAVSVDPDRPAELLSGGEVTGRDPVTGLRDIPAPRGFRAALATSASLRGRRPRLLRLDLSEAAT